MYKLTVVFYILSTASASPVGERIVNGTNAIYGEIPYIVSLRYYSSHVCGASILNARYILTAAHCTVYLPEHYDVQYGLTHIIEDIKAPNLIKVKRMISHENYSPENAWANDVAVVELEDPIPLTQYVSPVQLPVAFSATPANATAMLSGWGYPYSGGSLILDLQKVYIQVYSDDDCETIHRQTGPTNRTYQVCAGVPEGGKGQCTGDSGSPLIVDGVQVGIVSWSVKPCTVQGYPGVFTKVSSFVDWIMDKIN